MIHRAIEQALLCVDFRARIGCVVTDRRGRVISSGFNKRKTHPRQAFLSNKMGLDKQYLHAEIAALVSCRHIPHTIYIGRLKRNGDAGLATPCPICELAIKEAGIKRVIYTTNSGIEEVWL